MLALRLQSIIDAHSKDSISWARARHFAAAPSIDDVAPDLQERVKREIKYESDLAVSRARATNLTGSAASRGADDTFADPLDGDEAAAPAPRRPPRKAQPKKARTPPGGQGG